MGLPNHLSEPETAENALGDWHANTLNVGAQRYLHYLSEHGRLSIIITLRNRHDAEQRFLRRLSQFLRELEIPEKLIEREMTETSDLIYAEARDRSVLGSMRDHALCARHDLRTGECSLDEIMKTLGYMPSGPLDMKSADQVVPNLLREHWGGPRPVA